MKAKPAPEQNLMREFLSYSPLAGEFTWLKNRHTGRPLKGRTAGSINKFGYRRIWLDGKSYPANRLAWLYMTGAWPTHQIDHIDGVRSNDRWDNLREATNGQNKANSRINKNNSVGLKGVSRQRGQRALWHSRIMKDRQSFDLGQFDCPVAAHIAYIIAADRHFGEFARAR